MDPNRIYLPPPTTVGRFHFLFAQDAQTDGYFLESQIKKVCEENGAVLKGYSDRVVKQDFNGCKDTEVYADIEHPEWQIAFSDIILDLGLLWPDLEANFHLAATIEIPSATVFCRQLGPPLDFPAEAIYYGNFANRGQLLLHWEVSYRSNGERLKEGIKCSFVHDEGMAYFRFQNWEKSNDCDRNLESHLQWIEGRKDGKSCLMTYTIRLPYKNVKRLFVEQTADGTYLHFHTMVPPEIFRISEQRQKKAGRQGDGERTRYIFRGRTEGELPKSTTLCESPIFSVEISHAKMSDDTLYQLLGRMSQIGCMPIFYTLLHHKYELVAYRDDLGDPKIMAYTPLFDSGENLLIEKMLEESKGTGSDEMRLFRLKFLLEAVMSRGAPAKDRLLRPQLKQEHGDFWTSLALNYLRGPEKVERALEDLVDCVEDLHPNRTLAEALEYLLVHPRERRELTDAMQREEYVKVRKIVITPTRMLYIPAEVQMGNRVLREFGGPDAEKMIRVVFREDNGGLLRAIARHEGIRARVGTFLEHGPVVGGQKFVFLGQSNSQLRDQGAYFYMGSDRDANKIRASLGQFNKLNSVAKMVARMGQCFTQSKESPIELPRKQYEEEADYFGGSDYVDVKKLTKEEAANLKAEEPYTFSDGVGRISESYLKKIASMSDYRYKDHTPSCVQFRYRGFKGILVMDPMMDRGRNFLESIDLAPSSKADPKGKKRAKEVNIVFRDSQKKFEAPRKHQSGESMKFEVVKFSGPSPVSLNRPFINILCQVAEHQGQHVHDRVQGRILTLLDHHAVRCANALCEEREARNRLSDLPNRMHLEQMGQTIGMHLSSEPFFRALIKATVNHSLMRVLGKEQIEIPMDLGRSMFGVVDETGLLQYGQVFFQYSKKGSKIQSAVSSKAIHTGKVLITKNPSIIYGDARLFEAVDIPELRHLVDVIVFPRNGPRPHPDEMAGSDLDGDEYSVIWDPDLMFDHNEQAMRYPKQQCETTAELQPDAFRHKMVDYVIHYMTHDTIGTVSIAHLIQSDHYGLFSPISEKLARFHSMAVDFPKTGVPAPELTPDWEKDESQTDTLFTPCPGTKYTRAPDFMHRDFDPAYRCRRTVGMVYRGIKEIQKIVEDSLEGDNEVNIELDPAFNHPGWENMKEEAEAGLIEWSQAIKRVLDHYGVASAAEIITGCVMAMRNKAAESDGDQVTYFTTSQTIESTITQLWTAFRRKFFEIDPELGHHIGDYEMLTEPYEEHWANEAHPLHRQVKQPTPAMLQKATAYYKVAYEYARQQRGDRTLYLSFPWLVWDLLVALKKDRFRHDMEAVYEETQAKEFNVKLGNYVKSYARTHPESVTAFYRKIKPYPAIIAIFKRVKGLLDLCYFVSEWARRSDVEYFREIHMSCLFIKYATGCLYAENQRNILEENSELQPREWGTILIDFFKQLASRKFRNRKMLAFDEFGLNSIMISDEWIPLHETAARAFYSLAFSGQFESLMGETGHQGPGGQRIYEDTPFLIELPQVGPQLANIEKKLIEKLGLKDLLLRALPDSRAQKFGGVRVSALGCAASLRRLREALMLDPIIQYERYGPGIDAEYASRVRTRVNELIAPQIVPEI